MEVWLLKEVHRIVGGDVLTSSPVVEIGSEQPWLLTPRDVSRLLGISLSKVYQLLRARTGGLRSVVIGRSRRIRRSDLAAWLDAQQAA
jgi:excisionase family DNA binding protein